MKSLPLWFALVGFSTLGAQAASDPAYCTATAINNSPGQVVQQLYQLVSGAPGHQRDWTQLRALHIDGARIAPSKHGTDQSFSVTPMTVDEFIALNQRLFADVGFYETEVRQRVEVMGHIAHVWSHYVSRKNPSEQPYAEGVNSFQLIKNGERWCVLSATWDGEIARHQEQLEALFSGNKH